MLNHYEILGSLPSQKMLEIGLADYCVSNNFDPINFQVAENQICDNLNLTDEQRNVRQKGGTGRNRVITGRLANISCAWKNKGYICKSEEYAKWMFTEKGKSNIIGLSSNQNYDNGNLGKPEINSNKYIDIQPIKPTTDSYVDLEVLKSTLSDPDIETIERYIDEQVQKKLKNQQQPDVWIYFIQNVETRKIKIGKSTNIKSRLSALQTGSSERLNLLGYIPGSEALETELHDKFAAYRGIGEWFEDNVEIYRYIIDCDFNGDLIK